MTLVRQRVSTALWAWRKRRRNDFAGLVGWLLRQRCQMCGRRERHSWTGRWWPYDWLCETCTLDWMDDGVHSGCCHGIDDVCVASGCLMGIPGGERS